MALANPHQRHRALSRSITLAVSAGLIVRFIVLPLVGWLLVVSDRPVTRLVTGHNNSAN